MLVDHTNRFFFNRNEKRTLDRMAKDGPVIHDVEEGEISGDSASSIEEISEEDFRQDARVSRPKGDSRVWMNFPVTRSNYSPDLYNLAWAQAVQNKPLNNLYVRDFGSDEQSVRTGSVNSKESGKKVVNSEKEVCSVVIDDSCDEDDGEKEEGELEEGEIDLDSDVVVKTEEGVPPIDLPSSIELEKECENELNEKESEKELKEKEFRERVNTISEALKTVTVKDADASFCDVCFRIRNALESLQLLVLESRVSVVDDLIEQTLAGIRVVHSVFWSWNSKQKEQFKDELSSLFDILKKQHLALFSSEKIKEIEGMMQSFSRKEKEIHSVNIADNVSNALISSKKLSLEPVSVNSVGSNNGQNSSKSIKPEQHFGLKSRADFGPLIDLHADYDEGSLPSPTRDNPPPLPIQKCQDQPLPIQKPRDVGDGVIISHLTTARQEEADDDALHPYVTDALRAVSSYQQKFGRTSFLSSNRLPSPTPSGENDEGDGDSHGEVSSSAAGNAKTVDSNVGLQPPVSTTAQMDGLNGQEPATGKTAGLLGSRSNPILRPIKSRDPRLRFVNSSVGDFDLSKGIQTVDNNASKNEILGGIMSSRKHKVVDESVLDGHTLKRQRNSLQEDGVSKAVGLVSGSGGWLEDGSILGSQPANEEQLTGNITENMEFDIRKSENGEVGFNKRNDMNPNLNGTNSAEQQLPIISNGHAALLPTLLKDIAVNPTMLLQLIKMEQERLAAESRQKPANTAQHTMLPSCSSTLSGSVSSGSIASSKPSLLEQKQKSRDLSQTTSLNSQSEWGKVRMKPRDPRRILHNNIVQKSETSVSDQFKTIGAIPSNAQVGKDNISALEQGEQAVTSSHSQSVLLPDIAPQFTKRLKNIADILSNSQTTTTPVTDPQNITQPMLPSRTEKLGIKVATDPNDQQIRTGLTNEEVSIASSQSPNPWGDVEHLLEGYDDQQKAAIQRERARRIEEQNKMFAARKLCLVLDLDHTLLNSAKFLEVEKVHDEILRKKEEVDRDKPQRHLFRFPHMGMWTKLRPGIWNFLEKASKLFELHLYTMGNKYYATEMAKVLDPSGALFAGRVISRGDDGDPFDSDDRLPKSKDLDGVLGMESAVVIIDDSVRVWPHNKLNLIVVERYTFFPCSRRQFGLPGPSLLEIDHDERPEDGTLASSLNVIERIHQNFFSHRSLHEVDVRNILASEQRKILSGCRIVFSRVFPVGEANPHLHPLWQTAEQFGAVCTNQIDDQVTHVAANSLGTDKVNWALSTGRFVVHPGWVEASALLYRRANERDFVVK